MNIMNLLVDEIHDFVKTNIPAMTDNKKSKHVSFFDKLPSQATINPRNQGASLTQMYSLNHVHVDRR